MVDESENERSFQELAEQAQAKVCAYLPLILLYGYCSLTLMVPLSPPLTRQLLEQTAQVQATEAAKAEEERGFEEFTEGLKESGKDLRLQLEQARAALAVAERSVGSLKIEKDTKRAALEITRQRYWP